MIIPFFSTPQNAFQSRQRSPVFAGQNALQLCFFAKKYGSEGADSTVLFLESARGCGLHNLYSTKKKGTMLLCVPRWGSPENTVRYGQSVRGRLFLERLESVVYIICESKGAATTVVHQEAALGGDEKSVIYIIHTSKGYGGT